MTTFTVSNIGLQLFSVAGLQNEQSVLNTLNEQLASGHQHSNLTDYSPVQAQQLVNLQNAITQKQAYIGAIKTVNARLSVYDQTMSDMENVAAQAKQLATENPSLNSDTVAALNAQVNAYMQQVTDDLNQQVGNRYIYAGSRYATQPVSLNAVLAGTITLPFTPVTSDTLPNYDSEYNPPTTTTDANAWAQDSVTIDTSFNLQYGVNSSQTGFQQLIAGMQLINQATQTGVSAANYQTDMNNAAQLISSAVTNIQTYHTSVASATNILTQEQNTQNQDISNLQTQISGIQNVDLATVGTQIQSLETQLQASYSATAIVTQNSILKYL